ncbi:unnamed protein product [Lactuca virosa]|uniref:Uncharacterized protein n=1 Tax=Lactuca virosa TaxID=75947 RepID=A0AAU9NU37_9ASTR|nr:unnamed protein product [Lactuca virosa]
MLLISESCSPIVACTQSRRLAVQKEWESNLERKLGYTIRFEDVANSVLLAQTTEKHDLLQMRRVVAYIYKNADFALELAWLNNMIHIALPYLLQGKDFSIKPFQQKKSCHFHSIFLLFSPHNVAPVAVFTKCLKVTESQTSYEFLFRNTNRLPSSPLTISK